MLKKSICKRCLIEESRTQGFPFSWSDQDEERWKRGIVFCTNGGSCRIDGSSPQSCKYILEHLILGQKSVCEV